jgi:hypothetical protein
LSSVQNKKFEKIIAEHNQRGKWNWIMQCIGDTSCSDVYFMVLFIQAGQMFPACCFSVTFFPSEYCCCGMFTLELMLKNIT